MTLFINGKEKNFERKKYLENRQVAMLNRNERKNALKLDMKF